MYQCERTIKEAVQLKLCSHVWIWERNLKEGQHQRTDAFKLWCWRKLLSFLDSEEIKPVSPKGNQPWIFIGRTDIKLEAPVLWPPESKSQLQGKDSMLRKTEGRRRREWQRMKWLDGITDSMDMSLSKLRVLETHRRTWHAVVHGVARSQTQLGNWMTTAWTALSPDF